MACVIVPAAEAAITTIITKIIEAKETKEETAQIHMEHTDMTEKLKFSDKMRWLNKLLWGGSALLAFEHVWHGEITPYFPFLSGAENPAEMLEEMSTAGIGMAALVTTVWAGIVIASNVIEKRGASEADSALAPK